MNHPSVNCLSKLDVDFCQRHQCRRPRMLHVSVLEERGRTAHDVWWTNCRSSGTILRQNLWLCAVLSWSTNTAIGDSGHSPSQWVLGRYRDDFAYQRRVAMLAEAQRSIISTRCNKALSRAFLSRARSANNAPSQVGDQVMYWRGNNKRKSQLSMRWLGPGIVVGHEGRANVWISHRNAVVKAAGNHVRLAEVEEQLPWHDLYDSLRETDEQTYFDLSPLGVSRNPQYGGPSTSSDVPMTPVPVPDESMPDVITDQPDTSEIPVFPNSVYAPVRNPRVRWRSDVMEHPTPQTVSPPVVSSQKVTVATPSWSPPVPVTRETPSIQQPVTPQIDVQSELPPPASSADDDPMPFPHVDDTPPWSTRNQGHRGFLPSQIHQ